MDRFSDGPRNDDHVIVDIPQRLRSDEIERLNAAVSRAPLSKPDPAPKPSDDEVRTARDRALSLVTMRRDRERMFDTLLFSDPSWDLLLTLFVRSVDGHSTSVTSACNGIGVPPSTAFRHLSMLIEQGWATRHASDRDPGIVYVEISEDAFDRMTGLLLN